MPYRINLFQVHLSCPSIRFPAIVCEGQQKAYEQAKELPKHVGSAVMEMDNKRFAVLLLWNADRFEGSTETLSTTPADAFYAYRKIIENSISRYMRDRNFFAVSNRFGIDIASPQAIYEQGSLKIWKGINCKLVQPFSGDESIYLRATHHIFTRFTSSIGEDKTLKEMSIGRSIVEYREAKSAKNPLRSGEILGSVRQTNEDDLVVLDRQGNKKLVRLKDVTLAGNPDNAKMYERRLGVPDSSGVVLQQMIHSRVITASRRRNPQVLRTRMEDVIAFLSPSVEASTLTIPLHDQRNLFLELVLDPMRLKTND